MIQNRRKFIATIVAGSVAVPLLAGKQTSAKGPEKDRYPLRLFSKPLDGFDIDFICECVGGAGIGGLDLTVRPGGKIEPKEVATTLPKLIDRVRNHHLETDMIVTSIASAKEPFTEQILKTASESGVKYYRLGWFPYDNKNGIWETLQKYRNMLIDVVELNRKYKIHGGYQNHSGYFVGAPVWDLHELFRDFPPDLLGSQYDVRHAMVEGAETWMIGMRLIAGHITTLAIKDFTWRSEGGKPVAITVPLGEGMIDWDLFFQLVKELNISVPVTLHVEYPLLEKEEENLALDKKQEIIVRKLKKDADFIKSYLQKYDLS